MLFFIACPYAQARGLFFIILFALTASSIVAAVIRTRYRWAVRAMPAGVLG